MDVEFKVYWVRNGPLQAKYKASLKEAQTEMAALATAKKNMRIDDKGNCWHFRLHDETPVAKPAYERLMRTMRDVEGTRIEILKYEE